MSVKQVFNTSAELDYPKVLPTLDLDFANSKTLDPRIDFTRASGGSYVGADGLIKYAGVNEPRFDHDPETGESLGLLIEETRTNAFTWSEDFTTWGKPVGTKIIPNAIIAPDGTLTASKLVEDSILGVHYVFKTNSVTSGTTYTVSGYAKAAERKEVNLNFSTFNGAFASNSYAYFNLISGTFRLIGSSIINYGSEKLPNGWYRVWITATAIATVAIPIISPFGVSNGTTTFYVGDGTSGIYIWGGQLEVGTFPTSYIPTQGSTRTRQPDIAQITGKNFSDWYRQDEGTMFAGKLSHQMPLSGYKLIYDFSDGTIANERHIGLWNNTNQAYAGTRTAGTDVDTSPLAGMPSILAGSSASAAQTWNSSASVAASQGIVSLPANTAGPQVIDRLAIGSRVGGTLGFTGTIGRLTYFPKRLPNAQLQALTR